MSLIFATQLTAVATAVLALFAIVTAWYARRAFLKQSQEVAVLLEQNQREAAERRMAQAARVFLAADEDPPRLVHPYARNASDFPIYDAQIWYTESGRVSDPEDAGIIMPGTTAIASRPFSYTDALTAITLTFRDAAGFYWIRLPGGILAEQHRSTPRESILAAIDAARHGTLPLTPWNGKPSTTKPRRVLRRKRQFRESPTLLDRSIDGLTERITGLTRRIRRQPP